MRSTVTRVKTILTLAVAACFLLLWLFPSIWTGLLFVLIIIVSIVYVERAPRPAAPPHIPHEVAHGEPVAPPPAIESQPLSARDKAFQDAVNRFGIKAKRFSGSNVLDETGRSVLHFELEGLEVIHGELSGLRFVVESVAGYVTRPELEAGQLRVKWQDDSKCRGQTLPIADAVECVRKSSGVFRFDKLRPGDPPLSFKWKFTVLNSDALTEWEYTQLYGEEQEGDATAPRVAGRSEYFARVVWFPIESFSISLTLPSRLTERPALGMERLRREVTIPGEEVVRDSILQTYPRKDSEWAKNEVRWERDWTTEKIESPLLQHVPGGTSTLVVEKPPVGSRYLLGWPLPPMEGAPHFKYLVDRSQEVRQKSLEHAGHRRRGETETAVEQIKELFRAFDEEIRSQYAIGPLREEFTTTLMTYDQTLRHLVVVEGRNNGQEIKQTAWDFSLPFGFGLSGACFKEGNNALMYVRGEDKNADDGKYYLPVLGSVPYHVLMALPVDHRDFVRPKQENGEPVLGRSRQLIGVVSIGSSSSASKLGEFAVEAGKKPETAQQPGADPPPATADKLRELRARCQKLGDDICDLIQPPPAAVQKGSGVA